MRWTLLSLFLVGLWTAALPGPAAPKKVIDLKKFIDWEQWQLDITFRAKDTFEDRDYSGNLEMTATARYILKRIDKQDASGQWQALDSQSNNLVYKAFWQSKHGPARTDYASRGGGALVAPLADFHVGGSTPGYMLIVGGGFPAQMRDSTAGLVDCPLVLGTTEKDKPGLSGVVTGALPASGTTIHGSKVIQAEIAPFLVGQAGMTRMGIEYVLQPVPLGRLTQ